MRLRLVVFVAIGVDVIPGVACAFLEGTDAHFEGELVMSFFWRFGGCW